MGEVSEGEKELEENGRGKEGRERELQRIGEWSRTGKGRVDG